MSDAISRRMAIRWVKTECNPYGNPTLDFESGKKVIEHLEQMPSAQLEWKTGRITYTHFSEELWGQSAICVSCGCKWQIAEYGEDNFCPNCGVKLEKKR